MKQTRIIMGMPTVVDIVGGDEASLEAIFRYFVSVDEQFSTYKPESEIMKINRGEVDANSHSPEMKEIFVLAEHTRLETHGYFSITTPDGSLDPSGIVKGWAINNAAEMIARKGFVNYYVEIGGDIQSHGVDDNDRPWTIGIRNLFKREEIVKVLRPDGHGIATSGTAIRGQHIYDPHRPDKLFEDIASITVIGPNIYEADRFATAAFAMGREGIYFIEQLPGFEGYQIDKEGKAIMTTGITQFLI